MSKWSTELDSIEKQLGTPLDERYHRAFDKVLRYGIARLSYEDRTAVGEVELRELRATIGVEGAGGAYPGATAGFVVPVDYQDKVIASSKYAGPMLQDANVVTTTTGRPLAFPAVDDTSQSGVFVGEGASMSAVDISADLTVLGGYKVISGFVKASRELVEDVRVFPDLAAFLSESFGIRLGRLVNQKATLGSGSGEPTGYITAIGSAFAGLVGRQKMSRWRNPGKRPQALQTMERHKATESPRRVTKTDSAAARKSHRVAQLRSKLNGGCGRMHCYFASELLRLNSFILLI